MTDLFRLSLFFSRQRDYFNLRPKIKFLLKQKQEKEKIEIVAIHNWSDAEKFLKVKRSDMPDKHSKIASKHFLPVSFSTKR